MATVRLTDIIEPAAFTGYTLQETMQKTALVRAGVAVRNNVIAEQLRAGSHSFTVPFWRDLEDDEANIVNDDPEIHSTPKKIGSGKQIVRKSYLHQSWSAMNLASEIAGDDALKKIQSRVVAYWDRQLQKRLIASLRGIMADNVANDSSDMILDISAETGAAGVFGAEAVIDATGTLGDSMGNLVSIAMHSDIYRRALKNDLIEFIPDSQGGTIATFRGLATVVDDGLPVDEGAYTSVLFGAGAVGYGTGEPVVADGTEVENLPSAGRGGGQQILHSRMNVGIHPAGFTWVEDTVTDESPSFAELALPANWNRVVERKAIPLAFLIARAE
ncbi:major capsid protein [Billgrantia ethanolica]|uniref:Coat protein n=1 Tax=Billgrantia ethanolica TaxID=2733486 RepID=A0ABS9A365_9GAMM|nr:hypothetical protein [Halomonas ethanolica]MCE8002723.1 hypothetical protein [Halomonas ethanolica]